MNASGLNLLIPDKGDPERDSVAAAFAKCGGAVHRIGRFWDPPNFDPLSVRVYGSDSFCRVLQQKLGLSLRSPDDDLLQHVPAQFLKRQVIRQALGEISANRFPSFVKPVTPKQFRAAVYESVAELSSECRGLPPDTSVFISEVVSFAAEARAFVYGGHVLDASLYEGMANTAGAAEFVALLIREMPLPSPVVVDVGLLGDSGWAVIEFNAAWGAGLNGCDAERVLPAIVAASGGLNDAL